MWILAAARVPQVERILCSFGRVQLRCSRRASGVVRALVVRSYVQGDSRGERRASLMHMLSSLRRLGFLAVAAGSLFLVLYVLETFWATGELSALEPGFLGRCQQVGGLLGPEDLTIHPTTGVAFISAYDRRAEALGQPVRGAIYSYSPGSTGSLRELTGDFEGELRPHGISLYLNPKRAGWLRSRSGPEPKDRLFVVNHAEGRHSIEIFAIDRRRLEHLETVRDPAFVSPSDIVAVGPRSFYVANDSGTQPDEWAWYLENLWRFPFSNVVYFDGESAREVASRIAKASGIAKSADGKRIYVTALMGRKIHAYERDPDTGDFVASDIIPLPTNPDNIELDDRGDLWVGAHPKLVSLVRHVVFGEDPMPIRIGGVNLLDPASLAPSQVVRVQRDPKGAYEITEIYVDDGREISAASVAGRRLRRLLIGSLTDSHFLDCDFDPFPRRNYREGR